MPTSCIRVPSFECQLWTWFWLPQMCTLVESRWFLKYFVLCYPHEKPGLSSQIPASAWPNPIHGSRHLRSGPENSSTRAVSLTLSSSSSPSQIIISLTNNKGIVPSALWTCTFKFIHFVTILIVHGDELQYDMSTCALNVWRLNQVVSISISLNI